ncbi:sugar phosphate isomerase/epimerase [Pseudonocardia sp. ICBG1293]|uniref:sugar phosphate isomerase/epimerase family protein n=1 Tax=Pseudonocardia sp. ICBG1293 TaxID=2844382 RepID=UPI001CCD4FF0|nr:sugar phosphate isomerase/epimerase [Pseudonocardia sp. ICBG1293]
MAAIGVQAMMLKQIAAEAGPFEAMRRLVSVGFTVTELAQIPMTDENVAELARARDEFGLTFAALSAVLGPSTGGTDSLDTDLDKIVADARTLGSTMVRVAMLPFDALGEPEKLIGASRELERHAKRLDDDGIRLCYHNHHVEFATLGGTHLHDIIAEHAPSVGFELDTHWLQRAGLDPVQAITDRAGRVALVHLKDYRIRNLDPALFAEVSAGGFPAFRNALVTDAEVGEGNLDWKRIIPAARDAGAQYLLIEQEETDGMDILDCLRTSYRNIDEMGFGDLL